MKLFLKASKMSIADKEGKMEWERLCLMFLQTNFPGHPEVATFESFCSTNRTANTLAKSCWQQISILKAFAAINPTIQTTDYDLILSNIRIPLS